MQENLKCKLSGDNSPRIKGDSSEGLPRDNQITSMFKVRSHSYSAPFLFLLRFCFLFLLKYTRERDGRFHSLGNSSQITTGTHYGPLNKVSCYMNARARARVRPRNIEPRIYEKSPLSLFAHLMFRKRIDPTRAI